MSESKPVWEVGKPLPPDIWAHDTVIVKWPDSGAPSEKAADLPQWAADCVVYWKQALLLAEWNVRLKLVERPDDDQTAMACVAIYPETMTAEVDIRNDISLGYDPDWEKTIIHELVHIRIGRLTDVVQRDLLPELSFSAQTVAGRSVRRETEAAVELLTGILFKLGGSYAGR